MDHRLRWRHCIAWFVSSRGGRQLVDLGRWHRHVLKPTIAPRIHLYGGWLRYAWLALFIATATVAATTGLRQIEAEQSAFAALPPAPRNAANVLWIVMDTVPAKRMSLYGYDVPTSTRIDQFAGTGVVFDRCMSSSSWTLPGHATMFSGTLRHEQDLGWVKPFGTNLPPIAEVLRDRGYATVAFAANKLYLQPRVGLARGFCRYREPQTLFGQAIHSSRMATSITKRTSCQYSMGM